MFAAISVLMTFLCGFFRLHITTPKSSPDPISGIEQNGALINNGALLGALSALQTNASPAHGNFSATIIPNSLSARTMQGQEMVSGIIQRFTPGANFTDCTDTASNIIAAIPGAKVNQSFLTMIANLGSGIETIGAGTGVTLVGTTTISSNGTAIFLGKVLSSTTVSFSRLFEWGNGSGYTQVNGL